MKILIDPGHGGTDPGAVGTGVKEKDFTLDISLKVINLLKKQGLNVETTRDNDIYLDLKQRIKPCDISISIHVNSNKGQGLETWVGMYNKPDESKKLGQAIHENILKLVPFKDRGLKTEKSTKGDYDYHYMIRKPLGVPIMVECGFIDNNNDVSILKIYKDKISEGIAKGVCEYLGVNFKGSDNMELNVFGKDIELQKVVMQDNLNYVNLRELFEKLNCKVDWDKETNKTYVSLK